MGQISLETPVTGQPDLTEDPKIAENFQTLQTVINGNLDRSNISPSVVGSAGATNIATSESRTNTAYGTLTTPDQVSGVVLPTNGLIAVWYQATWKESVLGAARAAIFIGANQLKIARNSGNGAPLTQAAETGSGSTNTDYALSTCAVGLTGGNSGGVAYSGNVSTGQVVGSGATNVSAMEIGGGDYAPPSRDTAYGPCYIFAAAGTYTISVRFKASSGSVTASNRQLWVQVLPFS